MPERRRGSQAAGDSHRKQHTLNCQTLSSDTLVQLLVIAIAYNIPYGMRCDSHRIQHTLTYANLRPQRPRRTAAAASGGAAERACRRLWALTRFLGAGGHRCSGTCDALACVMLLRARSDSGGVI